VADGGDLIEVTRGARTLRFRPCGGRVEGILRSNALYEQQMLDYIEALAVPGVYADVGSYIGTHAIFFAAFCPASRVLAFEPRPRILEHLRANVAGNQLGDRIEVHAFGLSDRDETVTTVLDGKSVSFPCHPLDAVTSGPVSLVKLDVEGMEEKVLGGAAGLLARSAPLLFAEAHDQAALATLLAALAPHGYRPTGRIFNDTATYELAADATPVRLPAASSLLDPAWWMPDDPGLTVELAGRLRVVSQLAAEQVAHVTADPVKLTQRPRQAFFVPSPGAIHFLQATGPAHDLRAAWIYLMEYRGRERTAIQRHKITEHLFQRVELRPDSERVRVVVRVTGPGTLELERLAIHTLRPGG
jgi:FkbM family methyltransferase